MVSYQAVKLEPYYTAQEYEKQQVDFEKKYKKYEKYTIPRIVDVKVAMDILPNERNYKAVVNYVMVNKSKKRSIPYSLITVKISKILNSIRLSISL